MHVTNYLHTYACCTRWLCVHRIVLCTKYDCAVFYSGMLLGLRGNPLRSSWYRETESVKVLGNLFGRQVLVFNCDKVSTG